MKSKKKPPSDNPSVPIVRELTDGGFDDAIR